MTKRETAELLVMISVEFPKEIDRSGKDFNPKVTLWHSALSYYPFELVKNATINTVLKSHFCPKLADVVDEIKAVCSANEPTPEESWESLVRILGKVCDNVYRFGYTYVEEDGKTQGEKAREEVRRIFEEELTDEQRYLVGNSVNALISFSRTDDLVFEKARFIKNFDRAKQTKVYRQESGKFQALLDGLDIKQIG